MFESLRTFPSEIAHGVAASMQKRVQKFLDTPWWERFVLLVRALIGKDHVVQKVGELMIAVEGGDVPVSVFLELYPTSKDTWVEGGEFVWGTERGKDYPRITISIRVNLHQNLPRTLRKEIVPILYHEVSHAQTILKKWGTKAIGSKQEKEWKKSWADTVSRIEAAPWTKNPAEIAATAGMLVHLAREKGTDPIKLLNLIIKRGWEAAGTGRAFPTTFNAAVLDDPQYAKALTAEIRRLK